MSCGNGGLGMALFAFVDETGTHSGHPVTAVGGFLFDDQGVERFESSWKKRTSELREPFHASDCFHGYGQLERWPKPQRLLFMHDLPEMIIENRIFGFIAFMETAEYTEWCKENAHLVSRVGSPYTACLMQCVEIAGVAVKDRKLQGNITYVFEAGCDKELEASKFLAGLEKNGLLRAGLRVEGHAFVSKWKEPALCSADFLCWQWQKNYIDNPVIEHVSSDFKILINPDPTEMYLQKMTKFHLGSRALANIIHGVVS